MDKDKNITKEEPFLQKTLNTISMLLIFAGVLLFIFDFFGDLFDTGKALKKGYQGKYSEAAALRLGLTKTNIIRTVLPYIFFITGIVIMYFNQSEPENTKINMNNKTVSTKSAI